jgi:hypothetical protein
MSHINLIVLNRLRNIRRYYRQCLKAIVDNINENEKIKTPSNIVIDKSWKLLVIFVKFKLMTLWGNFIKLTNW